MTVKTFVITFLELAGCGNGVTVKIVVVEDPKKTVFSRVNRIDRKFNARDS